MADPERSIVEVVISEAEALDYLQRHEFVSVNRIMRILGRKKGHQTTKTVGEFLQRHGFERWTGGCYVRKGAD